MLILGKVYKGFCHAWSYFWIVSARANSSLLRYPSYQQNLSWAISLLTLSLSLRKLYRCCGVFVRGIDPSGFVKRWGFCSLNFVPAIVVGFPRIQHSKMSSAVSSRFGFLWREMNLSCVSSPHTQHVNASMFFPLIFVPFCFVFRAPHQSVYPALHFLFPFF